MNAYPRDGLGKRHGMLVLPPFLMALGMTEPNGEIPAPRFEAQTIDANVAIGYGLAIGDVDGDGRPDILLADKEEIVWYRNGDWTRFVIARHLTERDNVGIAARDITGDGRVEVAVGAQWNPGETSDLSRSGSVHYLIRPEDPTQRWEDVRLPHEPTVHRMRWVRTAEGRYSLVVVPLHGRGNVEGRGAGVRVLAFAFPDDPRGEWDTVLLDSTLNMTHNFEVVEDAAGARLYIGGRQGVNRVRSRGGSWPEAEPERLPIEGRGVGEIRHGRLGDRPFLTTIEPMHGTELAVYMLDEDQPVRQVLDEAFRDGHALATGDLLGIGRDQIVAGWRLPNPDGSVGIRLYVPLDESGRNWAAHTIDDNEMACEDLVLGDLNGNGKLDIIAAGRATNNLKIYWNRTGEGQ
jgi:hypothetical protein